ncbi:MAG: class I SAM-dependent methyltransferase [Gemmataceae bacterium]
MNAAFDGSYYRKQIGCSIGTIAWSHRARYRMALRLIGPRPGRLLDYGVGDGTLLSMAANRLTEGWGADINVEHVRECKARFECVRNLKFMTVRELSEPTYEGTFDVVTCMETLEHCIAPTVDAVLHDLVRLTNPAGRTIISVPIEIGPTFLVKSIVRSMAAWRGLSDYSHYESYPFRDAVRMICASRRTVIDRPEYGGPDDPNHSHYGFNWRALRERVRQYFEITATRFSPLGWLGGWFSSQVWFICVPKKATAHGALQGHSVRTAEKC